MYAGAALVANIPLVRDVFAAKAAPVNIPVSSAPSASLRLINLPSLTTGSVHCLSIEITVRYSMASPAAATAILVLFNSSTLAAIMSVLTSEIIRMAGGTIGCILIKRIRNCTGHAAAMTATTPRVPSVVARVVTLRAMTEYERFPEVC